MDIINTIPTNKTTIMAKTTINNLLDNKDYESSRDNRKLLNNVRGCKMPMNSNVRLTLKGNANCKNRFISINKDMSNNNVNKII